MTRSENFTSRFENCQVRNIKFQDMYSQLFYLSLKGALQLQNNIFEEIGMMKLSDKGEILTPYDGKDNMLGLTSDLV
jgi:hypothetical protein